MYDKESAYIFILLNTGNVLKMWIGALFLANFTTTFTIVCNTHNC